MDHIIVILGPTAVGKSSLAMHLARAFKGEIINADSRQVYRRMDIGTAKPSAEDRSHVRHHLIDILDPDQDFSLAIFLELAHRAIQDIHARGVLPIVVGGTGQYLWALLEGWQVPHVPPNAELRQQLEEKAGREGTEALHRELAKVDPEAASRIDPHNVRRVIRALEVYGSTGMPPSTFRHKEPPPYRALIIGLTMSREALYCMIDQRVEEMLEHGLLAEVQGLLRTGYSLMPPWMSSMGYKELGLYLNGELTLEEASERIKMETHRFARKQYAWFHLADDRIHWLDAGPDANPRAKEVVGRFLREVGGCGKITSTTQEKAG